uniref:Uncharacterized LOC130406846 n=1 Tax=Spodoptera frugiperda TaxID=7108 RepID=UPI0024C4D8C9|nr:Uncharacterized LOC130406846 [Spodoptera frugiperda]
MVLGKKQIEQLSQFSMSAAAYGAGSLVTLLYITEWKAVCKYIPFFNGAEKFQDPLPPPKPKPK